MPTTNYTDTTTPGVILHGTRSTNEVERLYSYIINTLQYKLYLKNDHAVFFNLLVRPPSSQADQERGQNMGAAEGRTQRTGSDMSEKRACKKKDHKRQIKKTNFSTSTLLFEH